MTNKRLTDVDIINSLDGSESFFVNKNNAVKQISKNKIIFNIANGGTGAITAEAARINLGAVNMVTATATLSANSWIDMPDSDVGAACIDITVSGVTSNNTIIVSPQPYYYATYAECGVRCHNQYDSGGLQFVCDEKPTEDLEVNVVILT